jgi:hypothetical protein
VLTLPEAAAFLRVGEAAVRGELEAGRLGGRLLAGEWRVSKAAILAWLAVPAPRPPVPATPSVPVMTDEEVEREIAELYAARRALGTVGDLLPDAGTE